MTWITRKYLHTTMILVSRYHWKTILMKLAYSVHKSGNERSTCRRIMLTRSWSKVQRCVWCERGGEKIQMKLINTEGALYDVIETKSEILKREKMWQNHTSINSFLKINAWPIQTQHRQLWGEDSFRWCVEVCQGMRETFSSKMSCNST